MAMTEAESAVPGCSETGRRPQLEIRSADRAAQPDSSRIHDEKFLRRRETVRAGGCIAWNRFAGTAPAQAGWYFRKGFPRRRGWNAQTRISCFADGSSQTRNRWNAGSECG